MHYFSMLSFQHFILAFFLGLGAVILTMLAFGFIWYRTEREEAKDVSDLLSERGTHLNLFSQFKENSHAIFLLLIYLGVFGWIVAYYFLVGLRARAIW